MNLKDLFTARINYGDQPVSQPLSALVPQANAQTAPQSTLDPDRFLNAIGQNETGGVKGNPYVFSQPSGSSALGNALGRYQVTEGELKTYGKKFLGKDVTPKEYLSSPQLQDNYMKNKAQYYSRQGYTPQDIADIHRKGFTNSYPAGSGKYQSPDYVNSFNAIYNGN